MRKRVRKGLLRRINRRVVLLTFGALALLILLFFASFWITTSVLKSNWEVPIPEQSEFATSSPDAQPEGNKAEQESENHKQVGPISDIGGGAYPSATKKPESTSPLPDVSEEPKASSTPGAGSEASATPKPEAPSEKPSATPEPVATPQPTAAPTQAPIDIPIIAPNAGE